MIDFIYYSWLFVASAGYVQVIMADMSAFYLTNSFTHNQISGQPDIHNTKEIRMCIYGHGLKTLGTVENMDLSNYSFLLKLEI